MLKIIGILLLFYVCHLNLCEGNEGVDESHFVSALVNKPGDWVGFGPHGQLIDAGTSSIAQFVKLAEEAHVDGFTDGEVVDAIEHYFWGKTNGLAIELGSLDGSPETRSMTYDYERLFGWRRLLIDGNPTYRAKMILNSPKAFSVNAAICENHTQVHFSRAAYVGGIVEFMSLDFIKEHHNKLYSAMNPPGNLQSVDWSAFPDTLVVNCLPMHAILHKAGVRHINYFILDVEGGEYEILKSINWNHTQFDVLCVETDPPRRPAGYGDKISAYLTERGYINHSGQVGRNIWFIHKSFQPSRRPGLAADCFNGFKMSDHAERWWANRRIGPLQKCVLTP